MYVFVYHGIARNEIFVQYDDIYVKRLTGNITRSNKILQTKTTSKTYLIIVKLDLAHVRSAVCTDQFWRILHKLHSYCCKCLNASHCSCTGTADSLCTS